MTKSLVSLSLRGFFLLPTSVCLIYVFLPYLLKQRRLTFINQVLVTDDPLKYFTLGIAEL